MLVAARSGTARKLLAVLAIASSGALAACSGIGPDDDEHRLAFVNEGPCSLQFRITGVTAGADAAPYVPRVGEESTIPLTQTGSVSIVILSSPARGTVDWDGACVYSVEARSTKFALINPDDAGQAGGLLHYALYPYPDPTNVHQRSSVAISVVRQ